MREGARTSLFAPVHTVRTQEWMMMSDSWQLVGYLRAGYDWLAVIVSSTAADRSERLTSEVALTGFFSIDVSSI